MATSAINNGISGLVAAQAGILTTSHNISNASTPGYSRQSISQTTNTPMQTGAGFFGQGTAVNNVVRSYSQFLTGRVYAAETQVGELNAYQAEISQIDNMLADASAGLSPALSSFFSGVHEVAANPSSIPARQTMISSAQALVARFQSINQDFYQQDQGVNQQIASEVTTINSFTAQIAKLNQQIILAQASSSNQAPNDLLDQRDNLIQQLNKEIRVTPVPQSDGTVSIFIGNGQPVVMNTFSYNLTAQPAKDDPQKTVVGVQTMSGSGSIDLQESFLSGGKLGGLIAFRNESLNPARNALGRVAIALAQNFNQQHDMGVDLNGAMGIDFFKFPFSAQTNMPAYMNLYANKNNAGTATLTAQILQSDYRVVFNAGVYNVYRLTDNSPLAPASATVSIGSFAPGGSLNVDGVTISAAAAAPTAGDAFTVKPGNPLASRVIADASNSAAGAATTLNATQAGINALSGSDYRIDYTGVITATAPLGYVVTRLSDNKILTPTVNASPTTATTNSMTFEGVTLAVPKPAPAGTPPAVGDSFTLQPTRNAARDIAVAFSDPRLIAAAAPFRTRVDPANTGSVAIDAGSMVALNAAAIPLAGSVTLTYAAATNTWNIAGPAGWPASIPAGNYTPGRPNVINLNGISFTISGSPQNGDKLYIDQNLNGVSDNRNAQALGALQTANTLAGNTASYEDAYSQIVSAIGNKAREVQVTGQAQQTLANEANDAVQQLSGVNLDEEAANLMRYQQAYQAASKMIAVAGKLFDDFLAAVA